MTMHRNLFVILIFFGFKTGLAIPDDSYDIDCEAVSTLGRPGFSLSGEIKSEPKSPQFKRIWISSLSFTEESIKDRDPIGILARWSSSNRLDFGWSPGKSGKLQPNNSDSSGHSIKNAFEFSLDLSKGKESTLVTSRSGQSKIHFAHCKTELTCQKLNQESEQNFRKLKQLEKELTNSIEYLGRELSVGIKNYVDLFKASSGSQVLDLEIIQRRLSQLPKSIKEFEIKKNKEKAIVTNHIQKNSEKAKRANCKTLE